MALFKNGLIGEVNGRVGNLVIRKINGKDFISVRPRHYKKTQSQSAKMIRSNFAQISQLASFINSEPVLSKTWRQSTGNSKSIYHEIIKTNLQLAGKKKFNTEYAIVPPSDLGLISSHQLVEGMLEINFNNCTEFHDEANDVIITLHIIIVLNASDALQHKSQLIKHFIITINKEKIVKDNKVTLNLNNKINMASLQKNIFILSAAVIWNKTNRSEQNWSLTYCNKLF